MKNRNILTAAVFAAILGAGYFFYRNYRPKDTTETEKSGSGNSQGGSYNFLPSEGSGWDKIRPGGSAGGNNGALYQDQFSGMSLFDAVKYLINNKQVLPSQLANKRSNQGKFYVVIRNKKYYIKGFEYRQDADNVLEMLFNPLDISVKNFRPFRNYKEIQL